MDVVDEERELGADPRGGSGRRVPRQAGLRFDLFDRRVRSTRAGVGGGAHLRAEPRDVGRRDLEARAGEPERAEVGHVRRAIAAAEVVDSDQYVVRWRNRGDAVRERS